MLVLKRTEGQWIDIVHVASGDLIRVRVYEISTVASARPRANLAFDDAARNFVITRPERVRKRPRSAEPEPVAAEPEGAAP